MIDRRCHSSIFDIRSVKVADCDTDLCMVVARVRGILAVIKEKAQKFDVEKFNLKKLNELEVRKHSRSKISNRFAALENLK